jgi:hypothetical protein
VSQIGHTARLHVRNYAKTEKLDKKPKPDQERSWYQCDADEPANE